MTTPIGCFEGGRVVQVGAVFELVNGLLEGVPLLEEGPNLGALFGYVEFDCDASCFVHGLRHALHFGSWCSPWWLSPWWRPRYQRLWVMYRQNAARAAPARGKRIPIPLAYLIMLWHMAIPAPTPTPPERPPPGSPATEAEAPGGGGNSASSRVMIVVPQHIPQQKGERHRNAYRRPHQDRFGWHGSPRTLARKHSSHSNPPARWRFPQPVRHKPAK